MTLTTAAILAAVSLACGGIVGLLIRMRPAQPEGDE